MDMIETIIKTAIVAMLFLTGVYLFFNYRPVPGQSETQQIKVKRMRALGLILIATSAGICVYFYFYSPSRVKASMIGDACEVCKLYQSRRGAIMPYKPSEIKTLESHAQACRNCSDECLDFIERAKRLGIKSANVLKEDCIETTKAAILAQKELDRLTQTVGGKLAGVKAFQIKRGEGEFPNIPKAEPGRFFKQ